MSDVFKLTRVGVCRVLQGGTARLRALPMVGATWGLLAGCTAGTPLAVTAPQAMSAPGTAGVGELVVYSATFAPTLEEGEYPAHTDYTVATVDDRVIERVTNRVGSFDESPAMVRLGSGEYHVRAQYGQGGFVVVPVEIEARKITTIDLDGRPMPVGASAGGEAADPIQLPGGSVIGWSTIAPH
jgi:hypothetical protein